MKKYNFLSGLLIFLAMISFAYAENWIPLKDYDVQYPIFISGTQIQGKSNITEPQTTHSEYLRCTAAGIVVLKQGAAFFLNVSVIKKPQTILYFKIEYPNPLNPKEPFINDMSYHPEGGRYQLSSPDVIKGLVGYEDYLVTIYVYPEKGAAKPIDILRQKIRCYVDTREENLLIFKKVLQTIPKK